MRMNPIYPNRAKLLRIKGTVTVVYNVNLEGKVSNIRVIHSDPPKIFENNVRLAMLSWIYEKKRTENNLFVTFQFNICNVQKLGE